MLTPFAPLAIASALLQQSTTPVLPIEPGTQWSYRGTVQATQPATAGASFVQKFQVRFVALEREADGDLRFVQFQECEPTELATGEQKQTTKGGKAVDLLTLPPARGRVQCNGWGVLWGWGASLDEPAASLVRALPWPALAAPTKAGESVKSGSFVELGGDYDHGLDVAWSAQETAGRLEIVGDVEPLPVASKTLGPDTLFAVARDTFVVDLERNVVERFTHDFQLTPAAGKQGITYELHATLDFLDSSPVPKAEFAVLLADLHAMEALAKKLDPKLPTAQFKPLLAECDALSARIAKGDLAPLVGRLTQRADDLRHAESRRKEEADLLARINQGPFPEIAGKDQEGLELALSDFEGQVVLLDLWESDCGFCLIEGPRLQRLAEKFESDGLVVLGVNTSVATLREIEFAKKAADRKNPQVFGQAKLKDALHVKGIPTHFLLDREGKLRRVFVGFNSLEDLEAGVAELLREGVPEKKS